MKLFSILPDPPFLILTLIVFLVRAYFFSKKHKRKADFKSYVTVTVQSMIVVALGYAWLNGAFHTFPLTKIGIQGDYSQPAFLALALLNECAVDRIMKRHVVIDTGKTADIHLITSGTAAGIYSVLLIAETILLKLLNIYLA